MAKDMYPPHKRFTLALLKAAMPDRGVVKSLTMISTEGSASDRKKAAGHILQALEADPAGWRALFLSTRRVPRKEQESVWKNYVQRWADAADQPISDQFFAKARGERADTVYGTGHAPFDALPDRVVQAMARADLALKHNLAMARDENFPPLPDALAYDGAQEAWAARVAQRRAQPGARAPRAV